MKYYSFCAVIITEKPAKPEVTINNLKKDIYSSKELQDVTACSNCIRLMVLMSISEAFSVWVIDYIKKRNSPNRIFNTDIYNCISIR